MDGFTDTERVVAVAKSPGAGYGDGGSGAGAEGSAAFQTVASLFRSLGLDAENAGGDAWNPLGQVVRPGARVVVKPNWVLHRGEAGAGLDCLITSTSVLDAILLFLARARPAQVVLGDAPLARCDFSALRRDAGIDALVERHRKAGLPLTLVDFRGRAAVTGAAATSLASRPEREGGALLFDLGPRSFLEPISAQHARFRVTCYDPAQMVSSHRPGVHRYSIARELLDADVVINVPKLKCHMKTCVTGALKNLVGINGDKAFLPHHRKGGSAVGGDCYPGFGLFRHLSEELYDLSNGLETHATAARLLMLPIKAYRRAGRGLGWDTRVEGAWYGNDTVWRTCLDLLRILRYGRADATLAEQPQRTVLSIVDAIVAGEGEGPLAPVAVPAEFMTAGANPVSVEWVNARLMGFDPTSIPLLREAMRASGEFPLVQGFGESDIEVRGLPGQTRLADVGPILGRPFTAPSGWRGHVEMAGS